MSPLIIYQPDEATGTATVILNRAQKKNALTRDMQEALTEAFEDIRTNDKIKRVVLRAADVRRDFCAGVDIDELKEDICAGGTLRQRFNRNLDASVPFARMLDAIAHCGKPILAVVGKTAIGAGATLAALSSYIVAGDDTTFRYPEWQMHLRPSISGPYVVARIGADNAVRLFSSGERFSAKDAQALHIVDRICPASVLPDMAQAAIRKFERGELPLPDKTQLPPQVKSDHPHADMVGLVENVQNLSRRHDPAALRIATVHEFALSRCSDAAVAAMQEYARKVHARRNADRHGDAPGVSRA